MKAIKDAIIYVPEAYSEKKKIGDKEIFLTNQFCAIANTVRYGEVIEPPVMLNNKLKKGDIVYFHHNIIRRSYTPNGKQINGMFEIDSSQGLYRCPLTSIYAYERDGELKAVDPFCYVKPIKRIERKVLRNEEEEAQRGIIKYSNDSLRAQGVKEGDEIIFDNDAEYEFRINGEKLYRMKTDWIIAKIHGLQE
jgi:hypothetical protein